MSNMAQIKAVMYGICTVAVRESRNMYVHFVGESHLPHAADDVEALYIV